MVETGLPKLQVKKLVSNAILPKRGSEFAAGYDLYSVEDKIIPKKSKALISTGISVAIPYGNYGRIAPRSGLAAKNFLDVGAGVVDVDYRGEGKNQALIYIVFVLLFNFSDDDFQVKYGDRIAQFIIEKITITEVEEVEELESTKRGEGGFGSTGVDLKKDNSK